MLQQITPRTHRNLTASKKGLGGRLLFFLRADTPRDKTTNKVILLNFRPPWAEVHFGSSGLYDNNTLFFCLCSVAEFTDGFHLLRHRNSTWVKTIGYGLLFVP